MIAKIFFVAFKSQSIYFQFNKYKYKIKDLPFGFQYKTTIFYLLCLANDLDWNVSICVDETGSFT